mgnify:CR=1 FL=1
METNYLSYNNTTAVLAWLLLAMLVLLGATWLMRSRDRQIDTIHITVPMVLYCIGMPAITAYIIWMPEGRFDVLFLLELVAIIAVLYGIIYLIYRWANWTFQFSRQYVNPLRKFLYGYFYLCVALFLLDIILLNF